MRTGRLLISTCLVVLTTPGFAGKFNRQLSVGDQAPAFRDLIGTDDQRHGLDDLQEARAVVVIFTCNHCPVAGAYEDRFVRFVTEYKAKGVAFVAISVSNFPADRLAAMKVRAAKRGFNFPYLSDPSQQTARDYGATCTPHVFVLDQQRKIAYMGAFDNHNDERKATKPYVRDAVEALLAGKSPEVGETLQRGCAIEYDERP